MNPKIEQAVQNLIGVIQEQFMQEAAETVLAAFGGGKGVVRRLSPNGAEALPKFAKLRKGEKRDPRILAQTTENLMQAIRKHPGEGIEALASRLGGVTKDLALPVKKLLKAKRIKTKGQKRATRYFPRG